MTMRVGVLVGHSENNQGASNKKSLLTEFMFNESLAKSIYTRLTLSEFIEPVLLYRRSSYHTLPRIINKSGVSLLISLHCNAFNGEASGTEVLYYEPSTKSEALATFIQEELVSSLSLPDRGIKPIFGRGRGLHLLKETSMPCVIAEPFFIDNDEDLVAANENRSNLTQAYVNAIHKYYNSYEGNSND